MDQEKSGILVPIPLPGKRLFRNKAMDRMAELLYKNPHRKFKVRDLREITGNSAKAVDTAIKLFEKLGIIVTERERNKKLISVDRRLILKPEDPVLEIPQEEFRTPVKEFLEEVKKEQENLAGVMLFGSVARGEANRTSDIDLLIIVEDNLMKSRREIQELRKKMSQKKFGEEQYEFQVMVESVESASQHGKKLEEIFIQGVALYSSKKLRELNKKILKGEIHGEQRNRRET
ncbi:MAG: nucleotidyltransferase domain-containing protein [Candidatus Nanohaloarchaea archaeon]|nr:nucleotidyltransferase domain-containing protein [Candidatus Nanohaloarchaea archaeon]